ncbi:MAG TPA: MFS transporter [Ktedonosporobacter sp.]|nr:MFS transporter [Ktedonosporobacter sp.]
MGEIAPSVSDELSTPRRNRQAYARYVFWVMFAISFLNYLDRNVLAGAANVVAKELGFGLDGIGQISSAFLVVYTLCAVPLGIWADRARRKDVVATCVAVWSLATALTALVTGFTTLFLSRMVLGIGEAGYFPAGTALLSDCFSREKRSRIMSWWSVAQLVGILVGFGVGGAVAGLYTGSWRLLFLFTGIPGLLLAWLVWRLREPRRNEADEEEAALNPELLSAESVAAESPPLSLISPNVVSQFRTLLRIRTLMVLIIMQIFAYFMLGVSTIFLPTYLQQKDTFGLSSGTAGIYAGVIIVVAGMAGTVAGGYMADMLNRRHTGARVLVCGIGFLISAPAFAITMLTHNLLIFTLFFIVTAFLVTVYQGPSTAATQDVVPSVLRASSVALTLLIAHLLGDAFAPALIGGLATSFDPTHGHHFLQGMAGQDLSVAMLVTCTPALVLAGLVGVLGARWMASDVAAAEQADRLARSA